MRVSSFEDSEVKAFQEEKKGRGEIFFVLGQHDP
jgi:hypothetical protein